MLHHVRSLGLSGVSGYEVTAECDLSGGLQRSEDRLLPQRELGIEIRALAQHLDRVDDVLLHALGLVFKHSDLCGR